jgi:hypothetical protein
MAEEDDEDDEGGVLSAVMMRILGFGVHVCVRVTGRRAEAGARIESGSRREARGACMYVCQRAWGWRAAQVRREPDAGNASGASATPLRHWPWQRSQNLDE